MSRFSYKLLCAVCAFGFAAWVAAGGLFAGWALWRFAAAGVGL